MTEKTCTRCYADVPADAMYRGRLCMPCRNEQHRLWRAERRDAERRRAEADMARIINFPTPGRVLR